MVHRQDEERGHRGRRFPHADLDDEHRLNARLWYLFMLLRHRDGRRRTGDPHAGEFRGQGRVLRLLSLHSPIAQKELAYLLGIRSQSLAEQLANLEAAGLVERTPDPEDRRTSLVTLTDKGREAVAAEPELPDDDPFSPLEDEEKRQLAGLLDRVIGGVEASLPGGLDPRMRAFKDMTFGDGPAAGWRGGHGPRGRGRGRFGPGF